MDKRRPPMQGRDVYSKVSLFAAIGHIISTRLWVQVGLVLLLTVAILIPLHHYIPSYREVWYGLRPSDKELFFEKSDDMRFVDEKTGQYLIWYETYPSEYRFYNGPGFYGSGAARELADSDEKIAKLKQWVDHHGVKTNRIQVVEPVPQTISPPQSSGDVPPVFVSNDPAYYNHGAIIPPNPKPLAWFQALVWGKLPPKPYIFNPGNGFFEIPGNPESRIAPHPHLVLRNNHTGLLERPFILFTKIHGMVPKEVAIPSLDQDYYRGEERNLGAVFGFDWPYKVTLGGVDY